MAAIHDLLAQVQDEALRARLEQEINRLTKQKKFGLVFEEHLPECTPLYDVPVKRQRRQAPSVICMKFLQLRMEWQLVCTRLQRNRK